MPTENTPDLRDWIGRRETARDVARVAPALGLAATLDRADLIARLPSAGSVLPPAWHWLYFLPTALQSTLGPDGHPTRGGFLPPVTLPRRMWAGSRLTFPAADRLRCAARAHQHDCRGRRQVRTQRRTRAGDGASRNPRGRRARGHRRARHRLSAGAAAGRASTAAGRAGPGARGGLPPDRHARPRPAVPLLRADLQWPPHPLRPQLRHRGGRLPGARRARPAAGDAAARPRRSPPAGCAHRELHVPRARAACSTRRRSTSAVRARDRPCGCGR